MRSKKNWIGKSVIEKTIDMIRSAYPTFKKKNLDLIQENKLLSMYEWIKCTACGKDCLISSYKLCRNCAIRRYDEKRVQRKREERAQLKRTLSSE